MGKTIIAVTVTVLLLCLLASPAWAGVIIKIGTELPGTVDSRLSELGETESAKEDTQMCFSVGGEYLFVIGKDLSIGAGFEYQLSRKIKQATIGFSFIPIYALGRYQFDSFYLTAKAGYNLFQIEEQAPKPIELKGGLFYGIGGGVVFADAWQVEVLYSVNNGRLTRKDVPKNELKMDWKYSKIGLSVGYMF